MQNVFEPTPDRRFLYALVLELVLIDQLAMPSSVIAQIQEIMSYRAAADLRNVRHGALEVIRLHTLPDL